MRICYINTNTWEVDAENRAAWCLNIKQCTKRVEVEKRVVSTAKRARKEKRQQPQKASVCVQSVHQRLSLRDRE